MVEEEEGEDGEAGRVRPGPVPPIDIPWHFFRCRTCSSTFHTPRTPLRPLPIPMRGRALRPDPLSW